MGAAARPAAQRRLHLRGACGRQLRGGQLPRPRPQGSLRRVRYRGLHGCVRCQAGPLRGLSLQSKRRASLREAGPKGQGNDRSSWQSLNAAHADNSPPAEMWVNEAAQGQAASCSMRVENLRSGAKGHGNGVAAGIPGVEPTRNGRSTWHLVRTRSPRRFIPAGRRAARRGPCPTGRAARPNCPWGGLCPARFDGTTGSRWRASAWHRSSW